MSDEHHAAAADERPAPSLWPWVIGPLPYAPPPEGAQRQSLHPLTPLLESFRLLVAAALASGVQVVSSGNWIVAVVIISVAAVFGGVSSLIALQYTGYELRGSDLHIYEGVLTRKHRTIPLERVQGIDIVQPLRARLFGLAQLRIEVAGANQSEPPLSFLRLDRARDLRATLLAVGRGEPAEAADPAEPAAEPAGEPLAAVPLRRLATATLLEAVPGLVIGAAFIAAATIATSALFGFDRVTTTLWVVVIAPSLLGYLFSVIRGVNRFLLGGRFRLARSDGRFHIERGITDRRSETVPLSRITAVSVEQPILWRSRHWLRVSAATASTAASGQNQGAGGLTVVNTLLPVGERGECDAVAAAAIPGQEWSSVAVERPPRRARWRMPVQWSRSGAAFTDAAFVVRRGLMVHTSTVIPYARLQSVSVEQGPIQRLQGLATLRAMTAGGLGHDGVAPNRDVRDAALMAAELRSRADAAAAVEAPRLS